ncbi:MAG TPA: hypothetical protein VFD05_04770 [Bacilli bacterium]|nr:hypothetical protein [Bacilli bacterium]
MKTIKKIITLPIILSLVSCQGNALHSTLNDERILFSLNKGQEYKLVDERLEEFDIWHEQKADEVAGKIFFYAYTYDEFLSKVDENIDEELFEHGDHSIRDLYEVMETYDQAYFAENMLLFYYKTESCISENYIYSVTKKEETLTLNVNRFEGMLTAISSWLEIITIKKDDIKDITKLDLIVRTITPLIASVTAHIDSNYAREFYVNPRALKVFNRLKNVEDIVLFNWPLNVDLKFNIVVTNEDVLTIVNYLENSPNVRSVGHKGTDFIRVQMNWALYDKVVNKTLVVSDLVKDNELINQYKFSINILDFLPFSMITFVLKNKGKYYADILIKELKKKNYPYINDYSIGY